MCADLFRSSLNLVSRNLAGSSLHHLNVYRCEKANVTFCFRFVGFLRMKIFEIMLVDKVHSMNTTLILNKDLNSLILECYF